LNKFLNLVVYKDFSLEDEMRYVFLTVLVLTVFFSGCDAFLTHDTDLEYYSVCERKYPGEDNCSQPYVNCIAYAYMRDWYLWYDKIPFIDPGTYETLGDMVKALRYEDEGVLIDRFSYSTKKEEHEDYYAGKRYGMGTSWKRDEENKLFITMVYPTSPADVAGLKRGQQILAMNGFTVEELDANAAYNKEHSGDDDFVKRTDWSNVYDAENEGEPVDMKLLEKGEDLETTVYLGDYSMKSVLKTAIVDNGGTKTGYIHFKAFITPSEQELNDAFAEFKKEKIEELVVDMRYNGGGLVRISEQLINLIAGKTVKDERIIKILYNEKHSDVNSHYTGKVLESSMDLKKVAFITTKGTASASEMVINSLQPFVDVSIIGDTTYGKPVGMNAKNICDQTIVPITFKNANAVDFGDYYHGISANCNSVDDYKHDFGDKDEASLKEALNYLKTGKCSETALTLRNVKSQYIEDLIPFELKGMNRVDYTF